MKKYNIKIGFHMTCAPTVYENVSFEANNQEEAIKKAKFFGEIFKKDFRDEHCVVFVSEINEKR